METIAAGRIAFWEGGSLWVFDVPDEAEAPRRTELHAHHAFQLTFSLGGAFAFNVENGVVPGPFAIAAPDTLHAFEARGLVSHLFVEPESRAGRTLEQLMQGRPAAAMNAAQVQDSPSLILEAFRHPHDPRNALIEAGQIRPVIDRTYALQEIADAHLYVDTGRKRGGVVVSIDRAP